MPGSPHTVCIVSTQRFHQYSSPECMKIAQRCPENLEIQDNATPFVFLGKPKALTLLFSGAMANHFCIRLILSGPRFGI